MFDLSKLDFSNINITPGVYRPTFKHSFPTVNIRNKDLEIEKVKKYETLKNEFENNFLEIEELDIRKRVLTENLSMINDFRFLILSSIFGLVLPLLIYAFSDVYLSLYSYNQVWIGNLIMIPVIFVLVIYSISFLFKYLFQINNYKKIKGGNDV